MIQIFQSDILKLKSIAVNFLPVITAFEIVLIGTDQDNQPDRGPLGRKIELCKWMHLPWVDVFIRAFKQNEGRPCQ